MIGSSQFKHSLSNPVGVEKCQELLLPLQQTPAAVEGQCLCGASVHKMHRLKGAEKPACHKMLCMPSNWTRQSLWHREGSEAGGGVSASHLLKARSFPGKAGGAAWSLAVGWERH